MRKSFDMPKLKFTVVIWRVLEFQRPCPNLGDIEN